MVTNYYVLSALAREWNGRLSSFRFVDAYSHLPGELTLEFEHPDGRRRAIRVSARPGDTFVYAEDDPRKPRSNVTSLFQHGFGERIANVEIAEGDRIIGVRFAEHEGGGSGDRIEIHPYGSRPNVYLVLDGAIVEAFKRSGVLAGEPPPPPRPPGSPKSREEFESRLREKDGDLAVRIRRLMPQLGAHLSREVVARRPDDLWAGLASVLQAARSPEPVVYRLEDGYLLSPIGLGHIDAPGVERFETMDEGVRWTIKRRSREQRLEGARKPLEAALDKSADRWARRVRDLESAMESESRANVYEEWGHLLMAHPNEVETGSKEVTLPNILADGTPTAIPLDPAKNAIQNAEKYYDKARRLREERLHLTERLEEARENRDEAQELLTVFRGAESTKEIEQLKKKHGETLGRFVGGKTPGIESTPFRRIQISAGYEVWVGRNAKENDSLTFGHASKHDLWMHARGVPGSHVVLRVPGRDQDVDRATKRQAAAIAAWFSRARGSGLVPVQIAQRKHVTKPRGAAPGVVRVQNEEVILVEPGLPDS